MRWILLFVILGSAVFISMCCSSSTSTAPRTPATPTVTPTPTNTYTPTLVPTRNANHTPVPGATSTPTPTITATPPSWTPTLTPTAFPTASWSLSVSFGQQGTDGMNGDFQDPMGIAVGAGFIAVSDQPASAIGNVQVFSDNGQYLYNIPANIPWGMTIDSYGELYVADRGVSDIRGYYLTRTGYTLDYTWTGQGTVVHPLSVKIDAHGNLVVPDADGTIYNLSWVDDSILRQTTGNPTTVTAIDVAYDAAGNIYAADYQSKGIVKYDANYAYQYGFTGSAWGSAVSQLGDPWSVAVDSQGNLFISDNLDSRVVYATPQGNYLGELDNFCAPTFLALDSADDLYVVDYAFCYRVDEFKK